MDLPQPTQISELPPPAPRKPALPMLTTLAIGSALWIGLASPTTAYSQQQTWLQAKAHPRFLLTHTHSFPLTLRGKDQFFSAAGLAPTYDWPNPRGKPHPHFLRTHRDTRELVLKDTQFGAAGQTRTYDWPNPQGKPFPLENRTWLQSVDLVLLGKDQEFAAPGEWKTYDWPIPAGKKPPIVTIADQPPNLALSILAPIQKPAMQADWPIPLRRGSLLVSMVTKPGDAGTPAAATLPFGLIDWPNPRVQPFAISNRTFLFYYVPDQSAPFNGLSDPNPIGKVYPIILRTWTQNLIESTLFAPPATPPFYQTNWPNPLSKAALIDLRGYVDPSEFWLLKDQMFGGAGQPLTPVDWPITRLVKRGSDWTYSLQGSTLAPIPPALPFNVSDWPNPQKKDWPLDLRGYIDPSEFWLLKDQLFGEAGQPLAPAGWPNPFVKVYALDLRTGWANLLETTLSQLAPLNQPNWPLPIGKAFPIQLRTHVDWRELMLQDMKPFLQNNWPNPQPWKVHSQLRTWTKGEWLSFVGLIAIVPGTSDVIVRARSDVRIIAALPDGRIVIAIADPDEVDL